MRAESVEGGGLVRQTLIACGILSSLLYVAMNVFLPLRWEGYSYASRIVSELSAIGAPTRPLWVALGVVYALLVLAFGVGVWTSAGRNRSLRVVGALLIAYGAFNVIPWPPMHLREVLAAGGGTLTDKMHIVWSFTAVLFMMAAIGFGASALGQPFRMYSIATAVILVALGALTGADASDIQANLPTPWVGVWERVSIGVFLLWVVVLAVALLRRPWTPVPRSIP